VRFSNYIAMTFSVAFPKVASKNPTSVKALKTSISTQLGRKRLTVIVPSLKTRFGAPEPLVIWAQLHAAGSNLAVCLRTGPELLGTVA
jgi:hypothetical protein